jgi:TRAP-type mannitol/chloroaromatic compound transport system substrate-binding protein
MTERRKFLKTAALAGAGALAASAFPKPALAQDKMRWRVVTSWPRGLPGLFTGVERLCANITAMSQGRMEFEVYGAGEIVPALECFQAVSDGTAEMGHDAAYYHIGKTKAAAFFTAVPFGMTANELNAWVYYGGGQELWDEAYAPFGLKGFLAGNTGAQMGGWFRKEINSPEDFRSLKMRIPGQGGQVMERLGATTVLLSGRDIFQPLQSNAIDAAEWVGPWNDMALNLHLVAKYYYYPGFQEPGPALQLTVNKGKWDALPADLQAIIATAASAENDRMIAEYNARSPAALRELVEQHGVQVKPYPQEVLIALGTASGELMREILDSADDITRRVANSFLAARRDAMLWTRISDQAFTNARRLSFPYPGGDTP